MKKWMKILSVVLCVCMIGLVGVFAVGAETVTSPADLNPDQAVNAAKGLFDQIAGTLNFANIAKVLAIGIGAVIGIWLAWWGIRKLFSMLQKVLTRGRMSL